MGSVSKLTIGQIQEILKDKVERTLLHSQHIVTDTNTFIESEVQKKIRDISIFFAVFVLKELIQMIKYID